MCPDSSDNPAERQTPISDLPGRVTWGEEPVPEFAGNFADEEGAVFRFLGVVRRMEGDRAISGIRYTAYPAMLRKCADTMLGEAREQFATHRTIIYHRLGFVEVGVPSIVVEVRAAHSHSAFSIGRFYLDQCKTVLPIWKEPVFETV